MEKKWCPMCDGEQEYVDGKCARCEALEDSVKGFGKRIIKAALLMLLLYPLTGFFHCVKAPETGWKICARNGYYLGDFFVTKETMAPYEGLHYEDMTPEGRRLVLLWERCVWPRPK